MTERLYNLSIDRTAEVYIYGTGIKAGKIFFELRDENIPIRGFIDRDESERPGTFFWGKKVYSLSEVNRSASIIVASGFWKEIENRLLQNGFENIYVDNSHMEKVQVSDAFLDGVGDYQFDRDSTYVVCPYGLGDTLYVCAFLREYKKEKNKDRVCAIVKRSHGDIAKGFGCIDDVICDDNLVEQLNSWAVRTETWELKNFLYGHFKKKLDMNFIRGDNVILDSMVTQYRREVMGLSEHSNLLWEEFSLPQCDDGGLDLNSVVLMPYANSIRMLTSIMWEELAKNLQEQGYLVYTNIKGEEEIPIEGTQAITGDISQIVSIMKKCKMVISLRSGLCDILAFCRIPMIVLYTDPNMYREWDLKFISDEIDVKNIKTYELDDRAIIDQVFMYLPKP